MPPLDAARGATLMEIVRLSRPRLALIAASASSTLIPTLLIVRTAREGLLARRSAGVNDPIALARGLYLGRITLTPSGALLPVHPYPVRIGRPADNPRGAVRPVKRTRGTHDPPGPWSKPGACLSLLPALGTPLAVSRVIAEVWHRCSTPGKQEYQKGGALHPPHA